MRKSRAFPALLCLLLCIHNASSGPLPAAAEASRRMRLMHPKLREFAVAACSRDSCEDLPQRCTKSRENALNASPEAVESAFASLSKPEVAVPRHSVGPLHTFTPLPESFEPLERMVLMANGNLQRLMRFA